MNNAAYRQALEELKTVLAKSKSDPEIWSLISARDEVLERYQPVFDPGGIDRLDENEFRSFLYFENNKHWTGLFRQVNRLTADMDRLRAALKTLLDESRPIAERFDEAVGSVRGLGKAVATAILLVAYPDRYSVWNNVSEEALKRLGLWPQFDRGATAGQRYEQINGILKRLAEDLGVDLWTLDALFWGLPVERPEEGFSPEAGRDAYRQQFGLERHLHEFLRDNWTLTELGNEWDLYSEPGDDEAGYEYPTDVGRIDLLAKHKTRPEWLVIELKRSQSTDQTVGQVLRYMGWVKHHLAEPGETVRGMIISQTVDRPMLYAIEASGNERIAVMRYEVDFTLKPARPLRGD